MLDHFKVPEADRVYVDEPSMRVAAEQIFFAMGQSEEDALLSADVLMFNDIRGVETHGVSNMLRRYVDQYGTGELNPTPNVTVDRETSTTAVLDADRGLGLHVAPRAMEMAIEKARDHGLGAVSVRDGGHMGGSGYHAMLALPHDMIGVAMTSSGRVQVLPTWGAEARFGTNPIAYAVPALTMPPFVFDIGTSQVAANKMRLLARVGAPVMPGWIATLDGSPVLEEVPLPDEFRLLPLGGTREMGSHKGYGFAAVVDILSGILSGVGPGFINQRTGYHLMAYRIDAFIDVDVFKRDMDAFLRGLAETRPAPGHDRVVYPGLLEAEEERIRLEEGIPYHTEVIDWFRQVESDLGLDFSFT